ncbi:hypothetical protein AAG906_001019 [Vitis piasezkii]
MVESASRKREKCSRYCGGLLVPPQLKGKSNVVTEDLSKLFVKKPVGSSSQ